MLMNLWIFGVLCCQSPLSANTVFSNLFFLVLFLILSQCSSEVPETGKVCLSLLAHWVAPASPNTVLKGGPKHVQLRTAVVRVMELDAFLYLWADSGEREGQHGKEIHLVPVSVLQIESRNCLLLWESSGRKRGGFSFLKANTVGMWHSSNAYPSLGAAMQTTSPHHPQLLCGDSATQPPATLTAGHGLWARSRLRERQQWCWCCSKDTCSLPKLWQVPAAAFLRKHDAAVIS